MISHLISITTASSFVSPVTLEAAKLYARIENTVEDVLIESMLKAVVLRLENYCNRLFVSRLVTVNYANLVGVTTLPFAPVLAITSPTDITLKNSAEIEVNSNVPVTLTYTPTAIYNDLIELAIKQQFVWEYEHRGDSKEYNTLSPQAKVLLGMYRNVYNDFGI